MRFSLLGNIAIKNKDTNDANNPAKKAGTLLSPRFFAIFIAIKAGIKLKIKPIIIIGINDKTKSLSPPFLIIYVDSTILTNLAFFFYYTNNSIIYKPIKLKFSYLYSAVIMPANRYTNGFK